MGNSCGCTSMLQIQSPRALVPSSRTVRSTQLTTRTQPKFTDIVPEQNPSVSQSERDLNLWNEQLDTFLLRYEKANGLISNRFTRRSIKQEREFNVKFGSEESLGPKQAQKRERHVEKLQICVPLTNKNISVQVQDSSSNNYTQNQNPTVQSCLLSQRTHLLNESIFTERLELKRQFYEKYNSMGGTVLKEWKDVHRLSYQLYMDEVLELRQICSNGKFTLCLQVIYEYWQNNQISLLCYSLQPYGLRVCINGIKRCFPFEPVSASQPALETINQSVLSIIGKQSICDMIFVLTGWIPECIDMAEVKNFRGIYERLANNLEEGNALITFTRITQKSQEYFCLSKIDFQKECLYLNSAGTRTTIPCLLLEQESDVEDSQLVVNFQNFAQLFDLINLNWNPTIYEVSIARYGIIKSGANKINKYRLVVPPCSQDMQIRLFFQKHHDFMTENEQSNIQISLFEEEGCEQLTEKEAIRELRTGKFIYSDVFIFQQCKQKTQYLLTVSVDEQKPLEEDVYFTISLLSFVEMNFQQVKSKELLRAETISTAVSAQNAGYGINSPYFDRNLQFLIEVQKYKELVVTVTAPNNFIYEICLIPDPERSRNLMKLSLQAIINDSIISTEKKGKGSFCVNTQCSNYILILNTYSQIEDSVEIKLELYGTVTQHVTQHLLHIRHNHTLTNVAFTHDVKWLPHHSGPRKRLKSNSVTTYQNFQTFSEFFKNPFIDRQILKGKYQFFVKSQTFKEYFDSVEGYVDKNQCQPPALSMVILEMSQSKQQFRIILDDAFYVPFGVGFWSGELELEEGTYRFVFPKIEKDFSRGTFGMIIC